MTDASPPPSPGRTLAEQLARLARAVHELDRPGDLADLRRAPQAGVPGFAFWRVLAQAGLDPAEAQLPAWIAVAGLMAMAHGRHSPGVRLGAALAAAGVSEQRLLALLRAQPPLLFDQARSLVHLLNSHRASFDHVELGLLLIAPDSDRAEVARRRVAADFFRTSSAPPAPPAA
jgi:CRISPR type I-E-associated protein CasB/Cse2